MNRIAKVYIALILVFAAVLGGFWLKNYGGTSAGAVEQDARGSLQIHGYWTSLKDTSSSMAAMVFYPRGGRESVYAVYSRNSFPAIGYHYRGGGATIVIRRGIAEFIVPGCPDHAFVSMNRKKIVRMVWQTKKGVKVREIESREPFVIVMPGGLRPQFYNAKNQHIPVTSIRL